MKYIKSRNNFLNESNIIINKKDIDVYRMSLYPGKSGKNEMMSNIREKINKIKKVSISFTLKNNDDVMVEFKIDDKEYIAKYNHTGTCEYINEK